MNSKKAQNDCGKLKTTGKTLIRPTELEYGEKDSDGPNIRTRSHTAASTSSSRIFLKPDTMPLHSTNVSPNKGKKGKGSKRPFSSTQQDDGTKSLLSQSGKKTTKSLYGNPSLNSCSRCKVDFPNLDSNYTSLGEHAYLTDGKCSRLKLCYTHEYIKAEIGKERYRRGLIAHPNVNLNPDIKDGPEDMRLTHGIYVTLCEILLCFVCGRGVGVHHPNCLKIRDELSLSLGKTLLNFKFEHEKEPST